MKRGGLAGISALILAICIAVPGLAQEAAESPPSESPQAVAERENSEYAYVDLTPAQEESLLREHFAPQLEAIDADPARALADVVLTRIDSPTEALVTVDGEKLLLESEVPLRAPEEDGDLHKVELELEETANGYEPANPLIDIALPDAADEPIRIGEEGLAVTPLGTTDAAASPLGEEDLFLPAAREDTSLLLSPIAGGLELSALLASRNSPQQLAFEVTLPPGATLRAEESGGAAVMRDGEVLATVSAPYAIDAQGTEVPVALAVEGEVLTLSVPHQEMDVAYPLFVDPEIEENWTGFADGSKLSYWKWQWSGVGSEDFIGSTTCIVKCWPGNGLYVRARSNFAYPAGSWARWWFTPQGQTTYMRRVVLGPINYETNGCFANEPHAYVGVWNDYSGWKVLSNAYPSGWGSYVDTGNGDLGVGTRTAFVGFHSNSASNLSCGRDYRLGGATLFLNDPENPTAGAPSGYPTGWIKSGATVGINAPVSDPGLGVYAATLSPGGSPPIEKKHGCDAHYSYPCPANYTFPFLVGAASFDEGEKPVKFSAVDGLGKPSNTQEWTLKVDRTPPEVDLAGQLAIATDEAGGDAGDDKDQALSLPVYNLQINATDGKDPASGPIDAGEKRSGVKKIEVFLDDRTTPEASWTASACTAGNCPMSKTFALKLNELSAVTEHTLRVLVTDFAGNAPRERKIEFEYIPATGMKDEYVMQYFPLPDGSGDEDEEENPRRPELAVNLINGNLVYRQKDVEVETASADLDVELYYNSLLPESQDSEWGDGWTMGQEPSLEVEQPPGGGAPEGTILEESGAIESRIDLPASSGESSFDKRIQATVTKQPGGGYELTDEGGETDDSLVFSSSGRLEEVQNGTAAVVDYDYEGGDLAEIAIEDPGTAAVPPGSLDEDRVLPDLAISYASSFGSFGNWPAQMSSPADVVADAQGYVYVLDRGNNRVQKFSPEGQILAFFGGAGSGNGQFNEPAAIAIDAGGDLWIADRGNHRVQELSPGGQFLGKFGTLGVEPGQLWSPSGIAVGADGTIWVSDFPHVQRFTASGQFIERVGVGQILGPQSLDVGPGGDVFLAEGGNDRISVFDEDGDFVRSFGSSGTGPGQFQTAAELDVDSDGNVWVADSQAHKVLLFNAAGEFVAQFGSTGSGAGQFKFNDFVGIAVDRGRVWVSDPQNNRVQRWLASPFTNFLHSANFGAAGNGDGQLNSPADVAADSAGNLYVLDRSNHRVQKFGPGGEFLAQFGGYGSADGQLNDPVAIAIDAGGDLWIADRGNSRVQKLGPGGQFLAKFGSLGGEPGAFLMLSGIAVGADGTIWVSDSGRVQRFSAAGQFIEQVGSGQIAGPQSLATTPGGNVLVAENGNDRVSVYDKNGDFVRSFGSTGTGNGQFQNPAELGIDSEGNAWVADSQLGRVQVFNASGDYLGQFGSTGSGDAQFKFNEWLGIAADNGRVWITDPQNNRVSEWIGGRFESSGEPVLTGDDPQLEVDVSEGLVESVEGEEAGTVSYSHSGDLLTSVEGPESEADFVYDEKGRMTKVTVANGTYAEIAYEPTYGRVSSVKVAIEGVNPKVTYFNYQDEPRRTTVTPPTGPITTYDIAADGSVFKWWNTSKPPTFDDIGGSLYDPANRETSQPIPVGAHTLNVQAHSDEGIASIQIIANNDQLVDEKTCTFDPEEPTSCLTVKSEWVTETANWPPGIVHLEIIATDRIGNSASQRFWVNIPYTPPPDPEAGEPPRFSDILHFREEFGLDLDLKGDEAAINDRIFDLMGAWHNPTTPEGEVARATDSRWGVPLRANDAAELEYRQRYVDQAAALIPQWGASNAPSVYAGYYVDHRQGGTIHVGFTSNQSALVSQLKAEVELIDPNRVATFPSTPTSPLSALGYLAVQVPQRISENPSARAFVTKAGLSPKQNQIVVGSINPIATSEFLHAEFGAAAPIHVELATHKPIPRIRRRPADSRLYAGDLIIVEKEFHCTLGFGAFEGRGKKPNGMPLILGFGLTAGHCGWPGTPVKREPADAKAIKIGTITRTAYGDTSSGLESDGAAILLKDGFPVPRWVYWSPEVQYRISGSEQFVPGSILCASGSYSKEPDCGAATYPFVAFPEYGSSVWVVETRAITTEGDSGGPVWDMQTGKAVGLVQGGYESTGPTWLTPLEPVALPDGQTTPGLLAEVDAEGGGHLNVAR